MSGRGVNGGSRGGRSGCGYRGSGRGSRHYTATLNKNKRLCSAFGKNVFNYGQKELADQMRTTWENIVHHVGTVYGHYISKTLKNKIKVFIHNPEFTEDVQFKKKLNVELLNLHSARLSEAREAKRVMLTQAVEDGNYSKSPIKMYMLEN